MNRKIAFWSILAGATVGQSLVVWLGPKYLVWYFTPPAPTGFDCSAPITWALSRMQSALLYGLVIGAIAGVVTAWLLRRQFRRPDTLISAR
jgi:hypothetical protein